MPVAAYSHHAGLSVQKTPYSAGSPALAPEWLDHPLKGNWVGFRECHVGGDFLLIYRLDAESKQEQIVFVRTGTHADLFEE
ncbi:MULTISPECIES: type II toxin-antitoxin system YafQ family toxin [Pseudomonas]|uniref:type II toxin-antitoxin system YafQ family toxin n=1 Tax=Pseudomonas TaxID=286 RepID=UPI001E359AE8|nr:MULTISPECIES: type II toxin-antitoxin system YafQ family toxin [Pseudomonas]MCE0957482.1 type II toxin-antitoxin system YafQ family toxin [Pseudomonas asiatica]MCE0969270.1 type II toxin-antitoxin system YafQ family toxin [Pseudomonas sp. NMI4491_12]MCE0993130.1 type II toxin-antitoxin system YafQ family toxin [Pseudomonas alloputida]MCE1015674.1 type II toxin-antitoxin system YafQ family toxin [Pseudomonas monteilii]MCE1044375.1 type II toxin-antitoxin system YafQ family toxin [Pseudomonas